MIPSYKNKEIFLRELKENVNKAIEKNDNVLQQKIEQMILENKHFMSNDEEKKIIKKILKPLKVVIIQSRNNPQDRLFAYKILNLVKNSESNDLDESSHWKDKAESKWEIKQFRKALLQDKEFMENFEFVEVKGRSDNYLGRGREGIVYLAKENKSGKLMAIKVKCERMPDVHPYNGEEEVNAVKLFHEATGYEFDAQNYSLFNAKSYIKGQNLEELLKSNSLFDGTKESQEILNQIEKLLNSLIEKKIFFADIAPENFVYDGEKFYMIDLRPVKVCLDIESTRNEYKNEMLDKSEGIAWSQDRWYSEDCKDKDKNQFIQFITNILRPKNDQ